MGGGTGGMAARGTRVTRVVGNPKFDRFGRNNPIWAPAFAGTKLDFRKPDLGARPGSAAKVSIPDNVTTLAEKYPKGVRYTRAGFPVFTPYAKERVVVDNLNGNMTHDNVEANRAAGIPGTDPPDGYTWHHLEDGKTMELVPSDLHTAAKHTGARPVLREETGPLTPGANFTGGEKVIGGFGGAAGAAASGPQTAQGN
jgi:hypothetical protein